MKKLNFILCLMLIIFSIGELESKGTNFPYSLGPFITLKGGVNATSVPNGIKNGFTINGLPDFGASGYIPLTDKSQFGIAGDLAYTTYAYDLKDFNGNNPQTVQISYLTLNPNLFVYGFTLGLDFGLPLSGTIKSSSTNTNINTSNLSAFVEFKLGGIIPLYYDDFGRVNLIVQFGYFLTGQYSQNNPFGGDTYNPHPASGSVGVSYLFNLTN
jgi:hypothetical protein